MTIVSKHRLREATEKIFRDWCELKDDVHEVAVGYVDYFGHIEYIKYDLSFKAPYGDFLLILDEHKKPPFEPNDKSIMNHFETSLRQFETRGGGSSDEKMGAKVALLRHNIESFRKMDWSSMGTWMYTLRERGGSTDLRYSWVAIDTKEDYEEALKEVRFHEKQLVLMRVSAQLPSLPSVPQISDGVCSAGSPGCSASRKS